MDAIVKLLEDKNSHLKKFYEINEAELLNFVDGNFDNLEIFYQSRETILDLIRCIDNLVDEAANTQNPKSIIPDSVKKAALATMTEKNEIVTMILEQDLQILSVIERAKSDIIKELKQVQAARKAVGSYKSGDAPTKLDEKA
jgi:hypothetical protein